MNQSTFKLSVEIPRSVRVEGSLLERDDFYSWAWARLMSKGLVGIHEGTMLSIEAAEEGLETDSWTLDAAEAPRERDWVAGKTSCQSEFYFESYAAAVEGSKILQMECELFPQAIEEQKPQDWDAQWKASFLSTPDGVFVPPSWRIIPPWVETQAIQDKEPEAVVLKINPGAGFGTGTHETTQLCLEALAEVSNTHTLRGKEVLDFGSGSGILAIGAALLGARVDAVEIDPLAVDNAQENAEINSIQNSIQFHLNLDPIQDRTYSIVIANILRPVLIEFAEKLVSKIQPNGFLILSGLIETDVPWIIEKYSLLLKGILPEKKELGEWRALVWRL